MKTSPQVSWRFFKAVRAGLAVATRISRLIRKERATRKNSQLAAARRVALKMGRRLRCSSVTYQFRYAPSKCQSGSDRLAGGPFWTQRCHHYMRDGAPGSDLIESLRSWNFLAVAHG